MLVLTIQSASVLSKIYSEAGYKPDFRRSKYAFLSPGYTKGYLKVLSMLSKKTNRPCCFWRDSCMWGWVSNPYITLHIVDMLFERDDDMYAIFCDIPEENMVLSDYDKYTSYCEDYKVNNFYVDSIEDGECIQCSFWELKPSDILSVVSLKTINKGNFMNCVKLNATAAEQRAV